MTLRVGIDLVQISKIEESLSTFGTRFVKRVFTEDEARYSGGRADRFAARFAAKEATRKALAIDGVGWRDVEVRRAESGEVSVVLHGATKTAALARGIHELALSLSHEGDYATAVVVAQGTT